LKILDIALKDLLRSFRNAFFLGFGLGMPVLMAVIFYFAFGGLASESGFHIPQVDVLVVNLDQPMAEYGGFSAGDLLAGLLRSEELAQLLAVTETESVASARAAVDSQEADVAVIIPAGLSAAVFDLEGQAEVEVYHDPTLTLGPGIVKSIIAQFVDALAGSKIAAVVAYDQLAKQGAAVDETTLQDVAMQYGQWATSLSEGQGTSALLAIQHPVSGEEDTNEALAIVSGVITGMMVFYAFSTGAASAMSILQEEDDGTLPRLFTTPTPTSAILGGKLIAVFALAIVQVLVLMSFSSLVFKTNWGAPIPLSLAVVGLVVLAPSFGIFAMSLLKDTRQAGVVIGGAMTVLGMVGMSSVFTASAPGAGGLAETLSLFVPQGWSMRAWLLVMDGGNVGDVLPTFGVMIALAAGFFSIGVLRFRKRFA
jgi:ABC-2 type transport system permease protein